MNEITLSSGLTKLAYEINGLKSNIGYSFYEIGRRLKKAKENNSNYGEWKLFLETINFSRTQADRLIVVFEDYSEGKLPDVGQIGLSLAYEIATLPEGQKEEQVQRIESGEKVPVREIQELKRQNKEQEKQLKEKDKKIKDQQETINRQHGQILEKPPSRVVEVEKEVAPDDYEATKESNKQLNQELQAIRERNDFIETQYNNLLEERKEVNEKSEKFKELTEAIKSSENKLNATQKLISDYDKILRQLRKANELIISLGGLSYMDISSTVNNSVVVRSEFDGVIHSLENLTKDLKSVRSNQYIEGEIVNEQL